jgi:hypothetical protein
MTTANIIKKFGNPATEKNITTINLPYEMRLAWDLNTKVNKLRVHNLGAPSLIKAFNEILAFYGIDQIKSLGIDLFGGSYNPRPMRGTEERYNALIAAGRVEEAAKFLSLHSWGLAIDLDPQRNQLKETSKTARFARPEYAEMIKIFERNGWYSLGKYKNYDWMHFQFIKP